MSVLTSSNVASSASRGFPYNGELPPEFMNSSEENIQRAAPASLSSQLLLQRPQTQERLNIAFADTLLNFAEAMKHKHELQQLVSYWKDMYDRLYQRSMNDNSQMSIEMRRKDDIIVQLQVEVRDLQAELGSPPSVYLSHWIDSHSESVKEEDLDDPSLATL